MYGTYLRRELAGRVKQTVIVAVGLAIAIALVIVVNALSAGVRDAQSQALSSVYGVGTDLTVTGAQTEPGQGGGARFDFGAEDGATQDGTTSLSQSRLMTDMRRGTLDASTVSTVAGLDGVTAATGALSLTNTTFSGEVPDRSAQSGTGEGGQMGEPPAGGGPGGDGGSAFGVDSFTVLGVDPSASVGPLSSVTVSEGRALTASDAGTDVAVIDATYATSASLAVGGTLDVGGTAMQIVGIVASTSSDADTAANVYLPLDTAQALAGVGSVVSTVYVQADSADAIGSVQSEITAALPDATVSSQSELASTVSGSLSSASALISNLGTWLSAVVLLVALSLAVLFTISGVARRTREFGTLKAIGWSNGRIVRQVAGESLTQGLLGGVAGLILGLGGILLVNVISPTISVSSQASGRGDGGPGGGGMGGPGGFGQAAAQATDIVLYAPVTPVIIVAAVGIAVLGGVLAGAFGGWRAARLSPAAALRSVA
ncbi:ABC-type antimicrobial peptide transport system, permease component [Microbacterium testaceum StLB037]|uniref:ABC-type antimicrobial peptide transport system, permease component n=1 Tax=Microbacterium testaceum (strain StLB037) TaxID=979556 RepID=E8N8H9_MICTS|nr:ABC transporter permease [Microbacterium testaceum]BAJ74424.1 ABC-type antimicrobial peptide transport system, permease component [Microbacterium testaceum StLB037]